MSLSRREFLVRSGWVAGGITVLAGCELPLLPTFAGPSADDSLTWVQLDAEGQVRFYLPRTEMGQGISTGFTQVVAEELNVGVAEIECLYPSTSDIAPAQMSVGSQSVENFLEPTARAAATLRELLRSRAAELATVPAEALEDGEGGFRTPAGELVSYRDIASGSSIAIEAVDPNLTPRTLADPARCKVVGQPCEPVHATRIVTGAETYSRDVMPEGVTFGAVLRPPYLGASLESVDRAAASAVADIIAVVDGPAGAVGVVALTPMAAQAALEALAPRWARPEAGWLEEIRAPLDIATAKLDHTTVDEGDVDGARAGAAKRLSLRYDTPMTAHAAMEPRAGVAQLLGSAAGALLEVWTGSQDPWLVRAAVARAAGMEIEQVVVRNCRVGGAFGGRLLCQASVEAAWLARAVAPRPVKVQWSREEEFQHNYVGPQFSQQIDAGLDEDGNLHYWHHRMVSSPILFPSAFIPASLLWLADLPADPGTRRGTDAPYRIPNRRVQFADVRKPMPTGAWRGLGAAPNTFAVECAIDELAHAAGEAPLSFRMRHADSPRLRGVLARLQEKVIGRAGVGVAAAAYKGVTFVAVGAEVAMLGDRARVLKLWCVHDCGRMIAPDQVRAQVQGNLVWGIGMALKEAFMLERGIAATDNFDSYVIPRNDDVPELDIELLESSEPPSGAGEAAFAPAAAAIANAVFAHSGKRHRRLPLGST